MNRLTVLVFGLLVALAATAAPEPEFASESDAERYRELTNELRCLVCQNQTIADSNAPLAVDLREQVAGFVKEGQSNEQIITYLTDRYGDFVLYRPPVRSSTVLLWAGPFLLLGIALLVMWRILKQRSHMALDDDEESN
ncbi:MAG: cytochrome c-type biogenesis protein [Gammaproteobacteria bacterium]|nr:cytochrome c-type biogenesis protein [Gammaproteobacteria bacterium]